MKSRIFLEVIYRDGSLCSFVRPAPELPPGFLWHKGMKIDIDGAFDEVAVESVVLVHSGDVVGQEYEVEVHLETYKNEADFSEESAERFRSLGWDDLA